MPSSTFVRTHLTWLAVFVVLGCSSPQNHHAGQPEEHKLEPASEKESAPSRPDVSGLTPLLTSSAVQSSVTAWMALPALSAEPVDLLDDGTIAPLSPAYQRIVDAAPQDPIPKKRASSSHFYAGNEDDVHIFYEDFKDRGGIYAGVGTEQAYIFIGWQRPQIAFLVDYDYNVLLVHRLHQFLILSSQQPEDFYNFWARKKKTRALLEEHFASDPELEALLEVFDDAQDDVEPRLKRLRRKFTKRGVPSFLTDEASLRYVQAYLRSGRARLMLVNLLEETGVIGLGATAEKLGAPIRVFYTSNAEQYWSYSKQFRANIAGLHIDDRSIVVRTLGHDDKSFDYVIQPVSNFLRWLEAEDTKTVYQIVEASSAVKREKGIRLKHTQAKPKL